MKPHTIFGNEPLYTSESVQSFASPQGLSTRRGECENRAKPHIYRHWCLWTVKQGKRLALGRTIDEAYRLLKGAK